MRQDPIWEPVLIPAAPLPIQLQGRPKALRPCTCIGDLEEIPGSWLRIGAAPAVAVNWGMNHPMEDLPLCFSSSMYFWLCNKKKKNRLKNKFLVKVLALHAQDPIWVPVLIPAAPLPIQLPACGLRKQWRTAQSLGILHLHGRPRRGSGFLASD